MAKLLFYLSLAKRVGQVNCLPEACKYLAHLPNNESDPAETLGEHMDLVLNYFERLCYDHDVETILERLIANLKVTQLRSDYLKLLFVEAIAFHDFGKVNENFQFLRMRNNKFRFNSKVSIKPPHGHSELGAFIFIVHHLENIDASEYTDEDKVWLSTVTLMFANSILLHHTSRIDKPPIERIKQTTLFNNIDAIETYLNNYGMQQPDVTKYYFNNIEAIKNQFESEYFDLWLLLRLNFSLLTSADYMATGHYMDKRGKDFYSSGTICNALRKRITENARKTEHYNSEAFRLSEILNYQFIHPIRKDGEGLNLNILRLEMAIEVIRTIRAKSDKHFFYLEAPTGGGKTNLSMLVTSELLDKNSELNKVFYVFPFTTLVTQTHIAIKKTLGINDEETALLHSKAGFQFKNGKSEEENDGLYGNEKVDYINNLFALYPIILLTHIRFFDILKSNHKETIYLMHRLANSIVVMDEMQSYSPSEWDKMLYFINNYSEIFNIRFVLMSATLPKIDKLKIPLENRPEFVELLPDPKRYFINSNFADRVNFNFGLLEGDREIPLDELATIVYEKSKSYADKHNSVHSIIEFIFKKAASDFYLEIEKIEEKLRFFDEILVLSGTILEPRRREVINYIKNTKNRSKNILLITTQVVEAGVDIDMDLGFKNISLIDSDEQLAGRVNRNLKKETCEVLLFKYNEPRVIYSKDLRWKVTKEFIPEEDQREILKNKDFNKLYNEVFKNIDKRNASDKIYTSDKAFEKYYENIQHLNFKEIHQSFKLIDQNNISVFVPINIPIEIPGPDLQDTIEYIFSKNELSFLEKADVWNYNDNYVDGESVWDLYTGILRRKKEDFISQKIDLKTMQGILGKFTFSIFDTPQMNLKLEPFCDHDKSLEKYLLLSRHSEVYSYSSGLMMREFDNPDHRIL